MIENADVITSLVSNVGFPIFMVLLLVFAGYKLFTTTFKNMGEELKNVKEVVENNNRLIEKLLDRLDIFWTNVEKDMHNRSKDNDD